MMMTMMIALLSACGNSAAVKSMEVKNADETLTTTPMKGDEPSKEAIAHYCSSMSNISPDQLKGVPSPNVQNVIAAQMAETARLQKISDWSVFEKWLRDTAPSDRQAALEALIQKHGLQSTCLVVVQ